MCTSRSKPFLTKTISYLYHSMVSVKKYSTQQSIIDIANVIQKNMDLRMFYLGIILDSKKAFDTVNQPNHYYQWYH